jgi:hypothetical protein
MCEETAIGASRWPRGPCARAFLIYLAQFQGLWSLPPGADVSVLRCLGTTSDGARTFLGVCLSLMPSLATALPSAQMRTSSVLFYLSQ